MPLEKKETQAEIVLGRLHNLGGLARSSELMENSIPAIVLRRMAVSNIVLNPGRGVYALPSHGANPDLPYAVEALSAPPVSVICLRTAAWLQGLIEQDPRQLQVFIPRETWPPRSAGILQVSPIIIKQFDHLKRLSRTEQGIDPTVSLELAGRTFIATTAARTVVDLFDYSDLHGVEVAAEALDAYMSRGGDPADIEVFADQVGIMDTMETYLFGSAMTLKPR